MSGLKTNTSAQILMNNNTRLKSNTLFNSLPLKKNNDIKQVNIRLLRTNKNNVTLT